MRKKDKIKIEQEENKENKNKRKFFKFFQLSTIKSLFSKQSYHDEELFLVNCYLPYQ